MFCSTRICFLSYLLQITSLFTMLKCLTNIDMKRSKHRLCYVFFENIFFHEFKIYKTPATTIFGFPDNIEMAL